MWKVVICSLGVGLGLVLGVEAELRFERPWTVPWAPTAAAVFGLVGLALGAILDCLCSRLQRHRAGTTPVDLAEELVVCHLEQEGLPQQDSATRRAAKRPPRGTSAATSQARLLEQQVAELERRFAESQEALRGFEQRWQRDRQALEGRTLEAERRAKLAEQSRCELTERHAAETRFAEAEIERLQQQVGRLQFELEQADDRANDRGSGGAAVPVNGGWSREPGTEHAAPASAPVVGDDRENLFIRFLGLSSPSRSARTKFRFWL